MIFTTELGLGLSLLAIAAALLWFGMPDKNGDSPNFLRFETALVLYPSLILVFVGLGGALLARALLVHS